MSVTQVKDMMRGTVLLLGLLVLTSSCHSFLFEANRNNNNNGNGSNNGNNANNNNNLGNSWNSGSVQVGGNSGTSFGGNVGGTNNNNQVSCPEIRLIAGKKEKFVLHRYSCLPVSNTCLSLFAEIRYFTQNKKQERCYITFTILTVMTI